MHWTKRNAAKSRTLHAARPQFIAICMPTAPRRSLMCHTFQKSTKLPTTADQPAANRTEPEFLRIKNQDPHKATGNSLDSAPRGWGLKEGGREGGRAGSIRNCLEDLIEVTRKANNELERISVSGRTKNRPLGACLKKSWPLEHSSMCARLASYI